MFVSIYFCSFIKFESYRRKRQYWTKYLISFERIHLRQLKFVQIPANVTLSSIIFNQQILTARSMYHPRIKWNEKKRQFIVTLRSQWGKCGKMANATNMHLLLINMGINSCWHIILSPFTSNFIAYYVPHFP